jgi:DNA-binding CsgD family transcriptional regulator
MFEISKGKTTQQIAEQWHRSNHTISNHRKNIIKKLGLKGTFRLTKFCYKKRSSIQTLLTLNKNQELIKAIIKN